MVVCAGAMPSRAHQWAAPKFGSSVSIINSTVPPITPRFVLLTGRPNDGVPEA